MGLLTLLDSRNHRWTQSPPALERILKVLFALRAVAVPAATQVLAMEADGRVCGIEHDARVFLVAVETRVMAIEND